MVFRGHCNACVVVVVMWPLSVACCGQVLTPVPMKDILAIKFDVNMVKTRNKYFKLNTTCASSNWKLNTNCVTMMIFRQLDLIHFLPLSLLFAEQAWDMTSLSLSSTLLNFWASIWTWNFSFSLQQGTATISEGFLSATDFNPGTRWVDGFR